MVIPNDIAIDFDRRNIHPLKIFPKTWTTINLESIDVPDPRNANSKQNFLIDLIYVPRQQNFPMNQKGT